MGLKYQSTFISNRGLTCLLEIYAKDYSGDVINITLTGTPVVHTWQTDEAKPAIKGSELVINILNRGTGITALPITDFMANEDDYFKVIFKVNGDTKFEGYLVQDDYDEVLVDYPHEISLKATDNLGLLKDILLGDAAIAFGDTTTLTQTIEQTGTDKIKITGTVSVSHLQVITIDSGTALDGQYSVKTWQYLAGPFTEITFESELNGTVVGSMSADMTYILPIDLTQRMFLSELLALCFKSTNLPLGIRVYGTIYPDGAANNRLFDNVMITPESFLSGDNWSSCYDIISRIIGRHGFTLFQAEGFWNLVRWDELRLHGNEIPGRNYNSDFEFLGIMSLSNLFTTGFEQTTFPEEGLSYTVQRPLKFDQETFNYRNPENLVRNANFTDVGELLSVTVDGTDTIYDYAMVGWEQGFAWSSDGSAYIGSTAERIIRVVVDAEGEEKERYGLVRGMFLFDPASSAQSNGVELRVGDRVNYSFDYRVNTSAAGPRYDYFKVCLQVTANPVPRSADTRWLNSNGKWVEQGFSINGTHLIANNVPLGDNSSNWHTVTINSEAVPFNGLVQLKLSHVIGGAPVPGTETHYRNIRFEVIRQVAGSTKITGHQHTSRQLINIKNTEETEIYVDNSPTNAIAGALFLETFTGPVQDLVTTWNYNGDAYQKLGHITTRDELFWRRIPRLKLEGTFNHLEEEDRILSALSVLTYAQFTDKIFIFGKLSIDYKRDKAGSTIFEIWETTEVETDLKEIYAFKYLYEKS